MLSNGDEVNCLIQEHNTASRVRIDPRPCDQESDALPAELSVLPVCIADQCRDATGLNCSSPFIQKAFCPDRTLSVQYCRKTCNKCSKSLAPPPPICDFPATLKFLLAFCHAYLRAFVIGFASFVVILFISRPT